MQLYHLVDALLAVVLVLVALTLFGILTRRVRFFSADSEVGGKRITEYIMAFCDKPGQARIQITEWDAEKKEEAEMS